jgi:hypothetical protein
LEELLKRSLPSGYRKRQHKGPSTRFEILEKQHARHTRSKCPLINACTLIILLIPIGIPLYFFILLFKERQNIAQGDPEVIREYDALLGDYEPRCYYWEIVEMLKKLTLTGIISLIAPGSSTQIAGAVLICFGFFAYGMAQKPMLYGGLDVVKGLGEFIVFIVMLGMLLSKTGLEEAEMLRLSTSLSFVSSALGRPRAHHALSSHQ